ncbi:A2MG-like protein [Mya arenaria]|uniref:A2MG-like protein n=1 Tax=Mya arenaria TaxID=6604 RepID=A0ABY7DK53_MYAAR|nr:A2MG-like protein [Mya arenaria]
MRLSDDQQAQFCIFAHLYYPKITIKTPNGYRVMQWNDIQTESDTHMGRTYRAHCVWRRASGHGLRLCLIVEVLPCAVIIAEIDGCYEIHINADELRFGEPRFFIYGKLRVQAKVWNCMAKAVVYENDLRYANGSYFSRTWTPTKSKMLSQWYSPSNSFIFIPEVTETPCDGTSDIDVYYTAMEGEDYRFTVTVLSNKMLLRTEEITQTFDGTSAIIAGLKPLEILKRYTNEKKAIGHFKLRLPVSDEMTSEATVLLYCMRSDSEVVAATTSFKVEKCFKNKVQMGFNKAEARPGDEVEYLLQAAPGSLCSVGMVDKSVTLLAGDNHLSPDEVLKRVNKAKRVSTYTFYNDENRAYCDKYFQNQAPSTSRPGNFMRSGFPSLVPVSGPDSIAEDIDTENLPTGSDDIDNSRSGEVERIRSVFPETWLWDLIQIGDTGTMVKQTVMPDTITEWQGNALCSHPSSGLGVSPLTSITGFQPFFASMTLPYSAVRGETLPVTVTVFNYLEECVAMEVSLREADGFEFTGVSGSSRHFCLCGGDSESTKFYMIPTIIGEIDLTAMAVSVADQMLCTNVNLNTDHVGVSDGVQKQLLIEFPELLVPDSTRATVAIVGDIMGPTLSNLQNILKMPYGCGEPNLARWVPNIFVLQYLNATGRSSHEITDKAYRYMRIGYQRQLKYRHNDNGYSIWEENQYGNETGSLWLTAFVVKSMAFFAKFLTIDEDDVNNSGLWILSHQQEDGCFPKVGRTFSSYLKGGLDEDEVTDLTAFILVALLEGGFSRNNQSAIDKGFSCIGAVDLQAVDTYTLSVIAYAHSLYNPRATIATPPFSQRSGQTHWERTPEADIENEDDAA